MWTIIGWSAIAAGLVLAVRYGYRAYGIYKNGLDIPSEKKAIVVNGGKAGLGALIVAVGIKLLLGLFLLVAVLTPQAKALIVCDQQGCREVSAPAVKKAVAAKRIVAKSGRKIAKINRGLLGEVLSPMLDYRAPLEACGYEVRYGSQFSDANNADVVIGHSMGIFRALRSNSKRVFTIDIPFWAGEQVAPHEKTANFPTVGHPEVRGAINVRIPGGHIGAPNQAKKYILAILGCRA